jgi:MFS family permease
VDLQGANVGELIGLLINGWVSERFGYRWTVIVCLMLINAWTALFFTAQNVQTLLAAEILCGIVCEPLPALPPLQVPRLRPSNLPVTN